MSPSYRRLLKQSTRGFSLVEVAISMAIMSFAMLSILGLIPMGLTNFRQAMNNTVESQIVQSLTGELQQTSFATLGDKTSFTNYYDTDGNSVADADAQAYYQADVSLVAMDSFPVDVTGSAYRVKVIISKKLIASSAVRAAQSHTYAMIVANQNN